MVSEEKEFLEIILNNRINALILERLSLLPLPDWYLTAGCIFQTIWNMLSGYTPEHGILDYDVFYCDYNDLSWEAEDLWIRNINEVFKDLHAKIQLRNQARVHLWYEMKFGIPCLPFRSSREGIDSFLNKSSCFGVRKLPSGSFDIYAPHGFSDLFGMILSQNRQELPNVFKEKADRWCSIWPKLRILS